MNRLTKTYEDGSFSVANNLPCGENSYAFKNFLINHLGEYEEIGLEPWEIKKLKEKSIQKKVLKQWESTIGDSTYYRFHCPNCENQIQNPNAKFTCCPYCGQRLGWDI